MKNFITILMLLLSTSLFSQTMEVSDYNNDGILEFLKYSDDGVLIEKGSLLNQKYHGIVTTYYPNGDVKSISKFNEGVKDGKWKIYNPEGYLTHEIVYEDNRRIQASITRYFD